MVASLFFLKFDPLFIAVKISYNNLINFNRKRKQESNMRGLIRCFFLLKNIVGSFNSYEVVSTFVDDLMLRR